MTDIAIKYRLPSWVFTAVIMTLIISFVVGVIYWAQKLATTTISETEVGEVLNAKFNLSDFGTSTTTVETTRGTFLVYGVFQSHKGRTLVLETRENSDQMLCDKSNSVCKRLAK